MRRGVLVPAVLMIALVGCTSDPTPATTNPPVQTSEPSPSAVRTKKPKPTATPVPAPSRTYSEAATGSLTLRERGLGKFDFGDRTDLTLERLEEALGAPTQSGPWIEMVRKEYALGGQEYDYASEREEPPDLVYNYPAHKTVCWDMLCTLHARTEEGFEKWVGWELDVWDFYEHHKVPRTAAAFQPNLRTDDGIGLGSPWRDIRSQFPAVTTQEGEGTSRGFDIGWEPLNCDGSICGTGRLEEKFASCTDDRRCTPTDDARVIAIWAGELLAPTCC